MGAGADAGSLLTPNRIGRYTLGAVGAVGRAGWGRSSSSRSVGSSTSGVGVGGVSGGGEGVLGAVVGALWSLEALLRGAGGEVAVLAALNFFLSALGVVALLTTVRAWKRRGRGLCGRMCRGPCDCHTGRVAKLSVGVAALLTTVRGCWQGRGTGVWRSEDRLSLQLDDIDVKT